MTCLAGTLGVTAQTVPAASATRMQTCRIGSWAAVMQQAWLAASPTASPARQGWPPTPKSWRSRYSTACRRVCMPAERTHMAERGLGTHVMMAGSIDIESVGSLVSCTGTVLDAQRWC